jgi:prepilin-type N-terminal cleavage/methylation domain-containing protein
MRRTSLRTKRGFTLIELMTAVVVVGVASAMAVPRFQIVYERMQFRAQIRNINSTLRLARSNAITTKNQFGVQFGSSPCTVTLFLDRINPANYTFDAGDSVIRVDTLPAQFTYLGTDCTNNVLTFSPNGSCGFSGGGNIYSLAYDNNIIAYHSTSVLASTGRLTYQYYFY